MDHTDNRQADRYSYIDALRVFSILLVFVYHVNMIFVAEWDWHIKADSTSNVLMEINYWMQFFRMPLLFFVSGFVSCILLERLSAQRFALSRFKRLIIPTVIWTFVIVAPQIYFERKLEGAEFNYVEFYQSFLTFELWPAGNFHWLHLWFIPYLFAYNLLSIPVFRSIQGEKTGFSISHTKLALCIAAFVCVAVIPYTFLSVRFPVTYDFVNDYARHAQFIPFVLAGLFAYRFEPIMDYLEAKRAALLRAAFLLIIMINVVRWNSWEPKALWDDWLSHPVSYAFILLLNINSWMWVLAILGYGKRYLNKGNELLIYSNEAVYPFYILHQTVVVTVGYYVVQTNDNAAFKYMFILGACFVITMGIYHLYIRPFKRIRMLFGSK